MYIFQFYILLPSLVKKITSLGFSCYVASFQLQIHLYITTFAKGSFSYHCSCEKFSTRYIEIWTSCDNKNLFKPFLFM
uniref:Uncharacterized protein n=1 Tax=Arundo donax TaxID=35708 RepID=A0A0A9BAG3_ARUDO